MDWQKNKNAASVHFVHFNFAISGNTRTYAAELASTYHQLKRGENMHCFSSGYIATTNAPSRSGKLK